MEYGITPSPPPLLHPLAPQILDKDDLIERLRQGDEAAFDTIFRAWYPSLVSAS